MLLAIVLSLVVSSPPPGPLQDAQETEVLLPPEEHDGQVVSEVPS